MKYIWFLYHTSSHVAASQPESVYACGGYVHVCVYMGVCEIPLLYTCTSTNGGCRFDIALDTSLVCYSLPDAV